MAQHVRLGGAARASGLRVRGRMSSREDFHGVRSGGKRKAEADEAALGVAPKLPKTEADKANSDRLIVVLDRACLETVKVGKGYELLNCDDHAHILKKHKREAAECRPDISHQMLLTLLDSPLNKAGKLQVILCLNASAQMSRRGCGIRRGPWGSRAQRRRSHGSAAWWAPAPAPEAACTHAVCVCTHRCTPALRTGTLARAGTRTR